MNRKTNFRVIAVLNIALLLCLPILDNLMARGKTKFLSPEARAAEGRRFRLEEATIAEVHRAIRAKQITVTQLVNLYLTRVKAYSGTCVQGAVDPATGLQLGDITPIPNAGQINAFITVNLKEDKRIALGLPERMKRTHTGPDDPKVPDALDRARELDAEFARTGKLVGPLHGIPFAIKDLFDTFDMRTTAGAAAAYANDKPPRDATVIANLRAAGAIILGKTNLDEYAPAGIGRSTFGGQTCNPYDTTRIPGGSSGGSGAAVAANLAMCALGTDTSGSVRNPAAYNNIAGMVATQGLVSRDGIFPLTFTRDRAGPTLSYGARRCGRAGDPRGVRPQGCRDGGHYRAQGVLPALRKREEPCRQKTRRAARFNDRSHSSRSRLYSCRQRSDCRHEKSGRDDYRSGQRSGHHRRAGSLSRAELST